MPRPSWTREQRRYAGREMAVGALISAIISIGFVFLIFGGSKNVSATALTWDAVPQSFMIVLMASLVPGLLARPKIASGSLGARDNPSAIWICVRAAIVAASTAAIALLLHALILPHLAPRGVEFPHVLIFKIVYGGLLGATAVALLFVHLFRRLAAANA
jgi:hypothetical protein